jgi:hypothetical protein
MNIYAILENNIVVNVVTALPSNLEANAETIILGYEEMANIGDTYSVDNRFRTPKPFNSWSWGLCTNCPKNTYGWIAPIPEPAMIEDSDGMRSNKYNWDEETLAWIEVTDVT